MKMENKLLRIDLIIDNEDESVKSEISGRVQIDTGEVKSKLDFYGLIGRIKHLKIVTDVSRNLMNGDGVILVDFQEFGTFTNPLDYADMVEELVLSVVWNNF